MGDARGSGADSGRRFPVCYSGNEGSQKGLAEIRERAMGRMVTAAQWRNPKPGIRWALDNGAFSDYQACAREGRAMTSMDFDAERFVRTLRKIPPLQRPDFAVIPDLVAEGLRSLNFSMRWLRGFTRPALPHGFRWYLAVQDGMEPEDVAPHVLDVSGLFVGGTVPWKRRTGARWVEFAHENGLPCHIGRVGTVEDLEWAALIGADSVDSSSWAQNDTYGHIDMARKRARAQRRLGEVA